MKNRCRAVKQPAGRMLLALQPALAVIDAARALGKSFVIILVLHFPVFKIRDRVALQQVVDIGLAGQQPAAAVIPACHALAPAAGHTASGFGACRSG